MSVDTLLSGLLEYGFRYVQIPDGWTWAPMGACGIVLLAGVLTLVRGAKWAPGLAALAFLLGGAAGGTYLAPQIGMPVSVTAALLGLAGGVAGLVLFRFWQALLLAACLGGVAVGVYGTRLVPEINAWLQPAPDDGLVSLAPANTVVGDQRPGPMQELSSLWTHLSATVPNFRLTFGGLAAGAGLGGLLLGFLLPRVSRALWSATLGTAVAGIGLAGLLKQFAPNTLDWLIASPTVGWSIVGTVWLTSLMYGYRSTARRKVPEPEDVSPAPEPA